MDVIKQLEQESKEYYDKWRDAEHRLAEEKLKKIDLNYVGKFVKYNDPLNGYTTYLYVREIHKDTIHFNEQKYAYVLSGFGFDGEMFGRSDNTWFDWDFGKKIYVYGNDVAYLKLRADAITEITAEDFDEAYERLLNEMRHYHEQYLRAIVVGKSEDLTQE